MSKKMLLFCIPAAAIAAYVLFVPPMPGVADQGDFQRVLDVTGLFELDNRDPESSFFKFIKTEYAMGAINPLRLLGIIPTTSMIYPIALARIICRLSGLKVFNTEVLALVYAVLYIAGIAMCVKWSGIKRAAVLFFCGLLSLFILMDGNYLVWFNSLYGEPMMIVSLLLFMASVLYASTRVKNIGRREIFFVLAASFLFIGSKTQCITALPFVFFIAIRVISFRKKSNRQASRRLAPLIPVMLLFVYCAGIYAQHNKTCGVDTKYNSVFYGILKNSDDPEKDLALLGLSVDLAVEAGKHAYLPEEEYVKYIPWSELTDAEFYEKISNLKLAWFYLTQPSKLMRGMEYTASQCFNTATFLGKYSKKDIAEYTYAFNRFTLWSDYGRRLLPGNLLFIVLFITAASAALAFEYRKRSQDRGSRLRIELLLAVTAIAVFQFPMPFIGNGEADTAKQLFLFNYIFDILIIVICTWLFNYCTFFRLFGRKRQFTEEHAAENKNASDNRIHSGFLGYACAVRYNPCKNSRKNRFTGNNQRCSCRSGIFLGNGLHSECKSRPQRTGPQYRVNKC